MKRFSFLLVVLMCAGFSMTAYAQSEQDAADEQIRAQEYQEYMESQQNVIDDGVDGVDEQIKAMENANAGRDFAEPLAGRGTIETADEYWEQNGYPDNISFAYKSSDEEGTSVTWWEIGMINADEAAKQEILDLVSPNCRVTFLDCAYSYNQRVAIMNEIYASRGDIILDVRMSRNTESIAVIVAEGYKEEYARKFLDEYGSIILVQDEEMPLEAMVINPISKKSANWLLPTLMIVLCGVATVVFFNRARLVPAFQTNSGNIVTGNAPVSKKQTIDAIKSSAVRPSDDVFASIMEKIEKAKK